MNQLKKRFLLFSICIFVRICLVLLAKFLPEKHLKTMGFLTLIPGLGFAIIYLFKLRKTGAEVFGNKIWWNDLRPIHATLYFMFAYYAINKNKNSYKILLFDVIFGTVAFLIYHYTEDSFKKLF